METVPQPPKFLSLLEDLLREPDNKPKGDYRHNPSSASMMTDDGRVVGACLRSLYYRAIGEKVSDPKELTSILQAAFGTAIGDYIEKVLAKSDKIRIIPEAPGRVIIDPLTKEISYRLDGLVTHKGEQGCLELKTMQSYGLNSMVKSGGPKESHILQVLCYFGTNPDLKWASLVYFSRDSAYRAEYHITKDPYGRFLLKGITPNKPEYVLTELSFDKVVARWKELEDLVDTKTLPKRDYKAVLTKEGQVTDKRVKNGVEYKTDFACNYCSYQTTCWSSPGADKDAYQVGGVRE